MVRAPAHHGVLGARTLGALAVLLAVAAPRAAGEGFIADAIKIGNQGLKHFKKIRLGYNSGKKVKKEYDALTSKPQTFIVSRFRLVKRDAKCGPDRVKLNKQISVQDCANTVADHKGMYFLYGGEDCYMEFAKTDSCEEGFQNSTLDFYAMDEYRVKAELIKSGKECKAKGRFIGNYDTVQNCAVAAQLEKAHFFMFGTLAPKSHKCYVKYTNSADCPEGFQRDFYDFYGFSFTPLQRASDAGEAEARIVRADAYCTSKDKYVGWYTTPAKCAKAVREAGGEYFIYGKHLKRWLCYMELTTAANCPEGFHKGSYDFWELLRETPESRYV